MTDDAWFGVTPEPVSRLVMPFSVDHAHISKARLHSM